MKNLQNSNMFDRKFYKYQIKSMLLLVSIILIISSLFIYTPLGEITNRYIFGDNNKHNEFLYPMIIDELKSLHEEIISDFKFLNRIEISNNLMNPPIITGIFKYSYSIDTIITINVEWQLFEGKYIILSLSEN